MHDLIREHARALADRLDPDGERERAIRRLLDYYQHVAARADALIARQARPALAPPDGAVPAAAPGLAGPEQALAWARAERASLLACLDHATGTGQHARVIALTAGLAGLWRRDGPWAEAITRHTAAVQAARHLGDRPGLAGALTDLGDIRWLTGDYPAAAQMLEQALDISRDLGDRLGQPLRLKPVRSGNRVSPARAGSHAERRHRNRRPFGEIKILPGRTGCLLPASPSASSAAPFRTRAEGTPERHLRGRAVENRRI